MKGIQGQKTINSWCIFFAGNIVFILGSVLTVPVFSMPREKGERSTKKISSNHELDRNWYSYISEGDMKDTVKYNPNNISNKDLPNNENDKNKINRLTSPKHFKEKIHKSSGYCFTKYLKEDETPYFQTRRDLDNQTTWEEGEKGEKKRRNVFQSPHVPKTQYVPCKRHKKLEEGKKKEQSHSSESPDPLNPIFQTHQKISDVIQTLEKTRSLPFGTNVFENFNINP